jgi:hypothetical protein
LLHLVGTRLDGGASKCTVGLWIGPETTCIASAHPVAANDLDGSIAAQQHAVPVEHRLVGNCVRKAAVEIDHHFRDAAFSRWNARLFCSQPKLMAQGRLNAVAVEDLALDFEGILIIGPDYA